MSEQNTSWLTACMRLMMTLRLRTKFGLISVAFLTPLAITVYALLSYARAGIEFAEKEIVGTVYLSAAQPLLRDVALEGAVNDATSALTRQMQQDNDALELDGAVRQLRAASGHEMGNALLSLYSDIGDRSNLILDPDIDSYYSMSMAVVLSPRMVLVQGQIAELLSDDNLSDPNVRAQLTALSARLQEYQFEVKQAWARATKGNPALANRINLDWQVANAAVVNAVEVVDARGAQLAKQAIQETLKINSISTEVLVELLQKRIDGLVYQRNLYIALAFASLLIVGYLIAGFYWCEVQGFGALTKRMRRLAEGNLVADFRAQGEDEIGDLINAYEHSRHELFGLIEKIHQVADTINTAGGEIAAANLNLSMRTSEQSQLISDAATQVEQVTDKVQANLESAANANLISREAFTEAESGKQVMDHVITTINAMKGSSTKIGAIIDVINEIAFQTNLLALNAAVEAARAGEQGRGFAVVAGEVRHLAQRCSTAANEITQLIKASVAEVDQGVGQVAKAGKSMQEILESTRTVSDIMGEMVTAGQTQAAAIKNIQSVVGKIDSDAQQNAAMVEQTSAAAELLHQQAQELMRSISRFLAHQDSPSNTTSVDGVTDTVNSQSTARASLSHAA